MTRRPKVVTLALALATSALLAQVDDPRRITYPPLPAFEIPKPEVVTLKNGLTLFLLEDRELPLITVNARIRTGSNYMPADREGMAQIFGQVQREGGTTSKKGDDLDDFLEARAASVETGMGGDAGTASMNCLAEDFDEVFRVFVDVLRHPAFAQDKIDLAKVRLNTSIARRNDNVGAIVGREFSRLIYGPDSPLSRIPEYATVARVTRDDLVAWHAKYYQPNNIYLGVVGDFSAAEMKAKLSKALEDWPKGPAFAAGEIPYAKTLEPGVFFIEKSDVTQANIRVGHLGIRRDNPDYYALTVMNEVLGGGFSGRLMQHIRTEKGLAYSVFGGVGASFLYPGLFQAGMSTKLSTTAQSARALQAELASMIERPATEEELKQAKESILNSFVFNFSSRAQILDQQMTFAYYGLPADYLDRYRAAVEKVTAADVARVAKQYLHPGKMRLLVVGKSAEFDEPVSALGPAKTIDITIPEPADTRQKVTKTDAAVTEGRSVLARLAQRVAPGGGELRSAKLGLSVTMSIGGQSMELGQDLTFVLPDKMRQVVKTPRGEQVVVVNGGTGVVQMGGRTQNVPAERLGESLKSLWRQPLVIASHAKSPDLEAVSAGHGQVNGESCDLVSVTLHGAESDLCVDADGDVLEQTYQGRHPINQTPGVIELYFSDHAEIGGCRLPRKSEMRIGGETVTTVALESLELNPAVEESQFTLPAATAAAAPAAN